MQASAAEASETRVSRGGRRVATALAVRGNAVQRPKQVDGRSLCVLEAEQESNGQMGILLNVGRERWARFLVCLLACADQRHSPRACRRGGRREWRSAVAESTSAGV